MPADFRHHHEESQREQLQVVKTPDFLLEAKDLGKFRQGRQLANFDYRLASCHSASISSIVDSRSFFPRSASLRSM